MWYILSYSLYYAEASTHVKHGNVQQLEVPLQAGFTVNKMLNKA
jgi:hypothetical protein